MYMLCPKPLATEERFHLQDDPEEDTMMIERMQSGQWSLH